MIVYREWKVETERPEETDYYYFTHKCGQSHGIDEGDTLAWFVSIADDHECGVKDGKQ